MSARGAESRREAWDRLLHLDDDSARLAMLLDRHAALDGMVAAVPESAGTDVAFVGVPDGDDRIVLLHKAGAATSALDRLVVPAGGCARGLARRLRRAPLPAGCTRGRCSRRPRPTADTAIPTRANPPGL